MSTLPQPIPRMRGNEYKPHRARDVLQHRSSSINSSVQVDVRYNKSTDIFSFIFIFDFQQSHEFDRIKIKINIFTSSHTLIIENLHVQFFSR